MSEKESDKNFVTTTCRVPKDLHAEVSRKMIGTSDSFQSVIVDGLREYVRRDKKVKMIREADVPEHARLGAAIMAALERWKTSDQKVAGLVVDQINFVLDVAAEEMGQ